MKVVLFHPDIPQNTGNILRTCAVTGTDLVLIPPIGFHLTSRWLKRSGLDYHQQVHLQQQEDWESLFSHSSSFYFFSSHAKQLYTDVSYSSDSLLVFGSETKGIPQEVWERWPDRFLQVPMLPGFRCLNLATTVGIVLYEAWRQQGFAHPTSSLRDYQKGE